MLPLLCLALLPARPAAAQAERVERGSLVLEGIPETPDSTRERLRQYQNTRAAAVEGWLPDGSLLVSTRFGETSQLHRVATPGGTRRQLTFFDEPVTTAAVRPGGARDGFVFGRDVGGSEFYQLFFFDLAGGRSALLTDGTSRNQSPRWSSRGDRFVFSTTQRNGRDTDLHLASPDVPGTTPVLEAEGSWSAADWAPDDAELLVLRYVSINESHPYFLNLATGTRTPLRTTDAPVSYRQLRYARDGRGVFFTSDENGNFLRLRYLDRTTGDVRALTGEIPWDVESFTLSKDGRHLAFTVNEEGMSRLYLLDTATLQYAPAAGVPDGIVRDLHFSADGTRLAFTLERPTDPADAYVLDLQQGDVVRWTFSETGGLDPATFVAPELVRYPTFDTVDGAPRTIPAFYYRPKGDGPFPVVIDIHGGPEGQARPVFHALRQYYLNELGVAVLVPNVRGSSGYGKDYLLLDNGFRREDSVRDIGALLDWVATRPELDARRVAVTGGSYGGYMTLAAMTHYNDRLRAGVDVVGISNFVTFLENTQDYRRDLRRAEYGDERDPEMRAFLTRISPTTNAARITRPLLVAQGLNDPRVPVTESEQMVRTIRENGGTVWYLLAKDEGHGFAKKANRDAYTEAVVLFFERFLLPATLPDGH